MFSNLLCIGYFNIAFIHLISYSNSNSNSIMAQLPPKIPSMAQNWPTSPHQKMTNTTLPNFITNSSHRQQQQCNNNNWMEELFDFTSSSRRVGHKRSMSDSDALFESPLSHNNGTTFDRFDDEQLMSMFSSDDMSITVPPTTVSSSNPSSPSDQNSNNDDIPMLLELDQLNNNNNNSCQMLKVEPGEIESSFDSDQQPQVQPSPTNSSPNLSTYADPINIDPKRVKRILANRQSAQRSRVRKLQYISELERSVTALQSEVSALSPRVAFLDHQRLILNVDNSTLKQRIAALAQDKIFKDAHQEALKKEIERLRQIYHQQNLKKMTNQNAQTPPSLSHQQSPNSDTMGCTDNK